MKEARPLIRDLDRSFNPASLDESLANTLFRKNDAEIADYFCSFHSEEESRQLAFSLLDRGHSKFFFHHLDCFPTVRTEEIALRLVQMDQGDRLQALSKKRLLGSGVATYLIDHDGADTVEEYFDLFSGDMHGVLRCLLDTGKVKNVGNILFFHSKGWYNDILLRMIREFGYAAAIAQKLHIPASLGTKLDRSIALELEERGLISWLLNSRIEKVFNFEPDAFQEFVFRHVRFTDLCSDSAIREWLESVPQDDYLEAMKILEERNFLEQDSSQRDKSDGLLGSFLTFFHSVGRMQRRGIRVGDIVNICSGHGFSSNLISIIEACLMRGFSSEDIIRYPFLVSGLIQKNNAYVK